MEELFLPTPPNTCQFKEKESDCTGCPSMFSIMKYSTHECECKYNAEIMQYSTHDQKFILGMLCPPTYLCKANTHGSNCTDCPLFLNQYNTVTMQWNNSPRT